MKPLLRIRLCGVFDAGQPELLDMLVRSLGTRQLTHCVAVQCETPGSIAGLAARDCKPQSAGSRNPAVPEVFLLMGLSQHHDADSQRLDQEIRRELHRRGQYYCVLYGSLQERLEQLLATIAAQLARASADWSEAPPANLAGKPRAWTWVCDKCSDPQCEHRLLTDLLASRSAGA